MTHQLTTDELFSLRREMAEKQKAEEERLATSKRPSKAAIRRAEIRREIEFRREQKAVEREMREVWDV